jgi:hypothetical protein
MVVTSLLGWNSVGVLQCHPHELSYFNEIAGGPAKGYRYLAEAALQWGQDLVALKSWVARYPEAKPLYVAYVGTTDPRSVGISYTLLPFWEPNRTASESKNDAGGQIATYAISVSLILGFDQYISDGSGKRTATPWNAYAYFSELRPVATAGYTINIYKISPSDLEKIRLSWRNPNVDH